jgi:hypothetical protein
VHTIAKPREAAEECHVSKIVLKMDRNGQKNTYHVFTFTYFSRTEMKIYHVFTFTYFSRTEMKTEILETKTNKTYSVSQK